MIEYLKNFTIPGIILMSLILNFGMYFFSIGIYYLLTYLSKKATIQLEYQRVKKLDVLLSILVVICNSSVFLLGFLLWKNGIITVKGNSFPTSLFEVVLLILAMDLAMYIFHRVAHFKFFFKYVHGQHHQHESTNAISLFVLHPLEALGFGIIMIIILALYPFSEVTVGLYLLINLLWGTIGHLNVEIFPKRITKIVMLKTLGTVTFHNIHHQVPGCNFGFYTFIWDKLFGTFSPEYNAEFNKNAEKELID